MSDTVKLFGIAFDCVRMDEAVDRILGWCADSRTATPPESSASCRFVVTPNVDHAVLFQRREALRAAYADASLVLADGAPIVWSSRLLGRRLPERVAGSDLVPALFGAAPRWRRGLAQFAESSEQIVPVPLNSADTAPSVRVFLLGAGPGVAERAASRIATTWPAVSVVGTYSPPLGFEADAADNDRVLQAIADASPDLLVVGLGAPKQEVWVHNHRQRIHAKVALCVGATIDFLAGEKRRSPGWMRRIGLEWLHRVATEPRRLLRRYARDACVFPRLVWREWRTQSDGRAWHSR